MCAASAVTRIKHLAEKPFASPDELLDYIYYMFGTGLESEDVFTAVMGIFAFCGSDVWLAIRMGASIGGDTDTIACLAGALCAAYANGHNIPADVVADVKAHNNIDIAQLCSALAKEQPK